MRFAILPQVLPNFTSYTLHRFEINVRAASVLGLVGAGGIGGELYYVIKQFFYRDISAITLMMIITVVIIDTVSERLRHRLIGTMDSRKV
jgi:phosphonate transport system permease protein